LDFKYIFLIIFKLFLIFFFKLFLKLFFKLFLKLTSTRPSPSGSWWRRSRRPPCSLKILKIIKNKTLKIKIPPKKQKELIIDHVCLVHHVQLPVGEPVLELVGQRLAAHVDAKQATADGLSLDAGDDVREGVA
jgi:hypothetical protein